MKKYFGINNYEVAFEVDNELKARFKSDRLDIIYNPFYGNFEFYINNDKVNEYYEDDYLQLDTQKAIKDLLNDCIDYYNKCLKAERCNMPLDEYLKVIEVLTLKEQNKALKDWEDIHNDGILYQYNK